MLSLRRELEIDFLDRYSAYCLLILFCDEIFKPLHCFFIFFQYHCPQLIKFIFSVLQVCSKFAIPFIDIVCKTLIIFKCNRNPVLITQFFHICIIRYNNRLMQAKRLIKFIRLCSCGFHRRIPINIVNNINFFV